MLVKTPDWVKQAIFYQIFPDRFARSPRIQHPPGLKFKKWGSPPSEQGFQGGDLLGIVDKLDYLNALGVTALYLNPIFSSASNHRYHTYDYFEVDPLLGGNGALHELLDEAHKRNIKVVLDGVFNHASRGFWQFHHILENGGNSPYIDWFIIHDWPLNPYPKKAKEKINYEAWWNMAALPKLNTKTPAVKDFILGAVHHWLQFGIDGWRLDVPAEIDDDEFWRDFRRAVKTANPDAYIVGELWEEAHRWLAGDQFDASMNYMIAWSSMSFFGAKTLRMSYQRQHYKLHPRNAVEFAVIMNHMHGLYDNEIVHAQLNLLDSHDTARALWVMNGDKSALRLCVLLQMTLPGVPCIYYGDEIGMSAGDDPDCREAYPWDRPEQQDHDLLAFYQKATRLRLQHPVLSLGRFRGLYAGNEVYGFARRHGEEEALVFFNAGQQPETISVEASKIDHQMYQSIWDEAHGYSAADGVLSVTIPARDAAVLWHPAQ